MTDDIEWPIPEEIEARIYDWHMKLMPHLLARDEDDYPVCVSDDYTHPNNNYGPELVALLTAIDADIGPWLASLTNPDEDDPLFSGPPTIFFHPTMATLIIGGTDYYLPLECESEAA